MIEFFSPNDGMKFFVKSRYKWAMAGGDLWKFVIVNVKGTISGVNFAGLDSVYHDNQWYLRWVQVKFAIILLWFCIAF